MPATIAGIHGGYVALGDSYSAGEGLPPFAPGTAQTNCDRSQSSAYPDLLIKLLRARDHQAPFSYTACSGALLNQILDQTNRSGGVVPPQISGKVQPSVGLVTLTIGGNNAQFSKVVVTCLTDGNCLHQTFPPPGVAEQTATHIAPGDLLNRWGPATIQEIGNEEGALFRTLRHDFPHARIIVIGYPYLFPTRSAPDFPFMPPMCASILNRLSAGERAGIRTLQDEFNDRSYEEAVVSGVEFVSPAAIWTSHEPCGANGQYTNSVKPYLNFPNPVNGGSFHPNAAGQQTLAALMACYLDANRQPPDPFVAGQPAIHTVPDRLSDSRATAHGSRSGADFGARRRRDPALPRMTLAGLTPVIRCDRRAGVRGYSATGDPHTGPGALVAEQGQGDRRNARVVDVPDRGPGVRRHPGGADVVRDAPEHGDVRESLVAGKVVAQFPAGLKPGELERRGRGGIGEGR